MSQAEVTAAYNAHTNSWSEAPTSAPTSAPTPPTSAPTHVPTTAPTTSVPTSMPSAAPSTSPTSVPSSVPSVAPTSAPTSVPTVAPTSAPTIFACDLGHKVTALDQPKACTACEPGRFSSLVSNYALTCAGACIAGRWQADLSTGNVDNSKCTGACPAGTYQRDNSTGNLNVLTCNGACPQGRYQRDSSKGNTDDSKCTGTMKLCPAGEHSPMGLACYPCPTGTRGQPEEGTSRTCTRCGLGYVSRAAGATACVGCEGNTATGIIYNASVCVECGSGQKADIVHATCITCAGGSYRVMKSLNESAVCVTCPPRGVVCREGRLQLTKKEWYPLGNQITAETEIHTCFNDESCIVYEYQSSSRIKCNADMGYYGPLCGACNRKQNAIRSGNGCRTLPRAITQARQ